MKIILWWITKGLQWCIDNPEKVWLIQAYLAVCVVCCAAVVWIFITPIAFEHFALALLSVVYAVWVYWQGR